VKASLLVACSALALISATASAQMDQARISHAVDSIAAAELSGGKAAGMSIAVVRARDTIVLRAYGKADLELDVPTPDRAVYEIGSVTKQFTAAAILQLAEQGKLSLDDEITKYFPAYPEHGHHITVRRLLDHTSGIPGYTEIPAFWPISTRSLPRDSLVALFGAKPLDFAPGTAMSYSNSAFFLLGLLIEKVSGQSYERYVQQHLFQPAGMVDSRYCSTTAVVLRRAHGYDMKDDTLRLAMYIDMTWPYSAGSLCSTAGDLAAWNRALHTGTILSPGSYHEMITPGTLTDGTRLRYAKGLAIDSLDGHRRISHGGGIPGFVTTLQYFPDDSLTVVVLINSAGPASPDHVARAIVDLMLGANPPATMAFHGSPGDYTGTYSGMARGGTETFTIAVDSGSHALVLHPKHGKAQPLAFYGGETFGHDEARLRFVRTAGRVSAVRVDEVYGYNFYKRAPVVASRSGSP
jgi:CubicO group peptidase (beta-lactamase class C family)